MPSLLELSAVGGRVNGGRVVAAPGVRAVPVRGQLFPRLVLRAARRPPGWRSAFPLRRSTPGAIRSEDSVRRGV